MNLIRKVLVFTIAASLASCGKPPVPPPTTQPAKPMVLVVPGLGDGQTDSVVLRLREAFGDKITVVDFSTGKNGYRADIAKYAAENAHSLLITIEHSYGVSKYFQVAEKLGDVALSVHLDGVKEVGQDDFVIPPNVRKTIVITGDFSGLIREPIRGEYTEYKIHKPHSAMAHDARTISLIESAVREAL